MVIIVGRISYGLKNEFESAMVNEPSILFVLRFTAQSTQWGHVERGQFT